MKHFLHIAVAACLFASCVQAQTAAPTNVPAAAAAEAAPTTQTTVRKTQDATNKGPAPGGARHLVWANSHTKRYHCYGAKYYGKTHQGAYTDETEAIEDGYRPSNGRGCSQ